ncbi:MAG: choice-of-anchor B family protein [Rhodothermales bacterium]|nr:choice-of-anchor B family protein [Rhodothermales bacterium]
MKNRYFLLLPLALAACFAGAAQAQSMRSETTEAAVAAFGGSVAVAADEVFVSSSRSGNAAGEIYRYTRSSNGSWMEASRLIASNGMAGDNFGRAMATHGSMLIVGATGYANTTGAAYVFEKDAQSAWKETGVLSPEDATEGVAFGRALGVAGDFVIASAAGRNKQTGAVYAFKKQGNAWQQHSVFSAAETVEGDLFGLTLATAGDLLVVGSPVKGNGRGAAYVFAYDSASDSWKEQTKLEADSLSENAQFGAAIAITEQHLFIGAPGIDGFTGAVYVYQKDDASGEWQLGTTLVPFDSSERLGFGASIAITDDQVFVGAQGADQFTGVVYAHAITENLQWTGATKIRGEQAVSGHGFGSTIAVNGAVAAIGSPGADNGEGIATIFERNSESGAWEEKAFFYAEVISMEAVTGAKVDCSEGSSDIFTCEKVDLMSFVPIKSLSSQRGSNMNDVWGWTDSETGKEYVLAGRTDGLSIVEISNPHNPVFVGDLPKTANSPASTWRDMKVYKDHVFVVADGAAEHGMQVLDLRQVRDVKPADMPVTFEPDALYTNIASAHNIVINEETGFAYAVGSSSGGETCGGGLHMIDIREPASPTFAGCFSDPTTGRASTGYSHDAQCVVYQGPDTEHRGKEICVGSNETAISIADVTDKENTVALARATYPNVGYAHQGWFTDDQRYFYMNDELDEMGGNVSHTRTLVWDLEDLDDPQLVKEFMHSTESIDHNLYVKGNYMYLANYTSGLRILDITDPANPVEWGHFDTTPNEEGVSFGGAWSTYPYFKSGVIPVTSIGEGLFLLKTQDLDI